MYIKMREYSNYFLTFRNTNYCVEMQNYPKNKK